MRRLQAVARSATERKTCGSSPVRRESFNIRSGTLQTFGPLGGEGGDERAKEDPHVFRGPATGTIHLSEASRLPPLSTRLPESSELLLVTRPCTGPGLALSSGPAIHSCWPRRTTLGLRRRRRGTRSPSGAGDPLTNQVRRRLLPATATIGSSGPPVPGRETCLSSDSFFAPAISFSLRRI
jgi:hypothetical protein